MTHPESSGWKWIYLLLMNAVERRVNDYLMIRRVTDPNSFLMLFRNSLCVQSLITQCSHSPVSLDGLQRLYLFIYFMTCHASLLLIIWNSFSPLCSCSWPWTISACIGSLAGAASERCTAAGRPTQERCKGKKSGWGVSRLERAKPCCDYWCVICTVWMSGMPWNVWTKRGSRWSKERR